MLNRGSYHRKLEMEPELNIARFFKKKKSKSALLCFKIFETKILHVDNVEIYKRANFQCKTRIILGYTKMTNVTKFQVFETVDCSQIQVYTFVIFVQPKI